MKSLRSLVLGARSTLKTGAGAVTRETPSVIVRCAWAAALRGILVVLMVAAGIGLARPALAGAPLAGLGPNVVVFDPSMPVWQIKATADAIWAAQVDDEMGGNRYALLFKPGTYGMPGQPLQINVGYYTEVMGLGESPGDVTIVGKVEVRNRCFNDPSNPEFIGCFALNNFWRGISNLTIQVDGSGQDGCTASSNFWAVSQAVSMRRVEVRGGNLSLMDYCTGPSFASGGFIADSAAGVLINGSQQQWYTRNSNVAVWTNAVWNQVFTGVIGAPDDSTFPNPPYTTLETTPVSREKPYLHVKDGQAFVRVPDARFDTKGTSWSAGLPAGRSLPLSSFFVARPGDRVQTINAALARGRHLLLTPGVYPIDSSIEVRHPNTVVLGLGLATLKAVRGSTPLVVKDNPGIVIAGVTIDAGETLSKVLLQVGKSRGERGTAKADPANPITLSDVYFRVGGPYVGKTQTAMQIDSDGVLIDHTWVWRADHGIEGFNRADGAFGDNERWRTNIGTVGLIVNGDDVTATGLFVEHFQTYNTLWNGERGRVYLYQNELPYDPPSQAEWYRPDGTLGYPGYKVADHVQQHSLWGAGVYCFNRNNPSIVTQNGYEVPRGPGISLVHVMTKNLSGPGTINAVVNGVGAKVDGIPDPGDPDNYEDPSYVIRYP
ncbi:hypothetical protein [Piscinibacter defluvii]|uniref:hypothetical protein n=1 Tax=Piscinibacter defluvii TaxID=1796922 RepID=UPI00197BFD29|nr:hypothetical protein [Piscinibacter defluvii]